MIWRVNDPQGNEAAKIKYDIVRYTRGRGLDLGCGPFKAFPHFIGVDNGHHWGNEGIDVPVETCEKLDMFADDSMDFVFSSHLLEHLEDPEGALDEWMRVIKPGGHLVLYLPHEKFYPLVGQYGANPDHKHNLSPTTVFKWMRKLKYHWDLIVEEERDHDRGPGVAGNEYSFFQVYRKDNDKENGISHRSSYLNRKPKKTCAVVRYGGFGDMIQASSILPGLKAQGYHITFFTTPTGHEILKSNTYIDDFFIQDKDQVPNNELSNFWYVQSQKFDKFVNLSESVEGSLLAIPGRANHYWNHKTRHKHLNVNYLEMTHSLAGVHFKPEAHFYPTVDEITWAEYEREKMPGKFMITWSLAGSSVHKTWPWLDQVIARILTTEDKDIEFVLIGDPLCKLLEAGWEKESRVHLRSGEWSIRQSLTFAMAQSNVVIGSETGVLNAVGLEDVNKIITLSHSSHENLTKHWKNTTVLEPDTDCYPCHMMHYNFNFCRRDEETGTAQCQADIPAEKMYKAIRDLIIKWRLKQ